MRSKNTWVPTSTNKKKSHNFNKFNAFGRLFGLFFLFHMCDTQRKKICKLVAVHLIYCELHSFIHRFGLFCSLIFFCIFGLSHKLPLFLHCKKSYDTYTSNYVNKMVHIFSGNYWESLEPNIVLCYADHNPRCYIIWIGIDLIWNCIWLIWASFIWIVPLNNLISNRFSNENW